MGVVDDGGVALGRVYRLQTAADTVQGAQYQKDVVACLAQHAGGAIDGEQVAHIELPDELHSDFLAVDLEVHALEMAFQETGLEIGHALCGVGLHLCLGVLHHEESVLVVGIGDGECSLWQTVEEHLLGVAVILERPMVVEVVAREVGEDAAGEVQASDAVLVNGVAAALHEHIFAAFGHHPSQQFVELHGVGGGVRGRHPYHARRHRAERAVGAHGSRRL